MRVRWRDRLRAWWNIERCGEQSPLDHWATRSAGMRWTCNRRRYHRGEHKDEGRFHRITWPAESPPTDRETK